MSSQVSNLTKTQFDAIRDALRAGDPAAASTAFNDMAAAATAAECQELACCAQLMGQLAELASVLSTDGAGDDAGPLARLLEFVDETVLAMEKACNEEGGPLEADVIRQTAHAEWGEYLELLDGGASADWSDDLWTNEAVLASQERQPSNSDGNDLDVHDDVDACPTEQKADIGQILSLLDGPGNAAPPAQPVASKPTNRETPQAQTSQGGRRSNSSDAGAAIPAPPEVQQVSLSDELLEAYADDVSRCLASLEELVLGIERSGGNRQTLRLICRELHTLKGASASVGLERLANYLHRVEEFVESMDVESGQRVTVEPLLSAIDAVRNHVTALGGSAAELPTCSAAPVATPANEVPASALPAASAPVASPKKTDGTLRVSAARVDRLMDLLAELVIVRNDREAETNQLKSLGNELVSCAGRFRWVIDQFGGEARSDGSGQLRQGLAIPSNTGVEISSDVAEAARLLRDVAQSIAEQNRTISRIIGEFRHELVELRRVPVAGLFQRLVRTARDAARLEDKDVHVQLLGEQTGLERALQEQLYEPLLHVVRNAVSHGIEERSARTAAGKPTCGTVTLQAESSLNSLVIKISDDGQGIDAESIRRKAVERGLLDAAQNPSESELYRFILHPGFSTRQHANEVSGRGVGLDVVASTLESLRGRFHIDSVRGRGTTIQLTIPLRSVVEHTMVFRSGDQLFALPMHAVGATASAAAANDPLADGRVPVVSMRRLLHLDVEGAPDETRLLMVRRSSHAHSADQHEGYGRVALAVDEVLGPQEVVVRPLPPLLRNHPLLSAATLGAGGQTVFLFESQPLLAYVNAQGDMSAPAESRQRSSRPAADALPRRRALVVDDSMTARRRMCQILEQNGFAVTEAHDGVEAMACLRSGEFEAVFSDIDMPRLGGLDLLSQLRAAPATEALPFVFVTSRREAVTIERANALGAAAYLNKPVEESKLAELLESLGPAKDHSETLCTSLERTV